MDDADDSDYEGNVTETGAFAGPGYVEMPKSRAHRLLDKFRFGKNKDKEEPTPQEWLDVDESFDAPVPSVRPEGVGAVREEEAFGGPASETLDGYDEQSSGPVGFGDPYDGAAGPALASDFGEEPQRSPSVGVPPLFDADDTLTNLKLDDLDVGASSPAGSHDGRRQGGRRRWNGGAFSRRMMNRTEEPEDDGYGEDFLDQPQPAYDAADELDQIYQLPSTPTSTPRCGSSPWARNLAQQRRHAGVFGRARAGPARFHHHRHRRPGQRAILPWSSARASLPLALRRPRA